jgi:MFS family permease
MNPAVQNAASLLGQRHFVLYWLSRVSATVALQMQAVAIGWQMYDMTRNPLDLGLVGLFHFIPAAVLVLVAGHLADRHDRRLLVRTCQFAAGCASATLAYGTVSGWLTRESLLLIVLVVGAARSIEQTAQQTLLPGVVPSALLARATAASSSATQLAVIFGPALGGLLYAVTPVLVYALCCALWIAAGLCIGVIKLERAQPKRETVSVATLLAGFHYVRHHPIVLGAIGLDLFAILLGSALALLPVFARDILQTDSLGLGLLRSAPGIGALLTAIVLTRWQMRTHVGRIVFAAVAVFGLSVLVFALSRSFALSMVTLAFMGAADMVNVVIRMTLIQLHTPDDMRGRVSAVNSLCVIASNQLGEFRAGLAAAWLGAVQAAVLGGVCALVVVAIGRKWFAGLYGVETLDPVGRR